MKLEQANGICRGLLMGKCALAHYFKKWLVCGSIRRKCENVNDIDIVAIPKPESEYGFGDKTLDDAISLLHEGTTDKPLLGEKLKRFFYRGISIDIYLANAKTFETLKLIRTGSKEHNIRLTTLARGKGLKLYANGKGLCKIKGGIYNNEPEEIMGVVEDTEDGILNNLLGRAPTPEQRN